jgi:hypothetical protein
MLWDRACYGHLHGHYPRGDGHWLSRDGRCDRPGPGTRRSHRPGLAGGEGVRAAPRSGAPDGLCSEGRLIRGCAVRGGHPTSGGLGKRNGQIAAPSRRRERLVSRESVERERVANKIGYPGCRPARRKRARLLRGQRLDPRADRRRGGDPRARWLWRCGHAAKSASRRSRLILEADLCGSQATDVAHRQHCPRDRVSKCPPAPANLAA